MVGAAGLGRVFVSGCGLLTVVGRGGGVGSFAIPITFLALVAAEQTERLP